MIRSRIMPISPRYQGEPVPSMMRPFVIRRSYACGAPSRVGAEAQPASSIVSTQTVLRVMVYLTQRNAEATQCAESFGARHPFSVVHYSLFEIERRGGTRKTTA